MLRRYLACASLLAGLAAMPALAQSNNPDFKLHNRGSVVINEIYVSSSAVQAWGRDRLGDNTLPPGRSVDIVLPAGQCVNDMRIVYANGQAEERRRVNTCELTDVNFPG